MRPCPIHSRLLISSKTLMEATMLPDAIELRAKIKEINDRLELLRGHL